MGHTASVRWYPQYMTSNWYAIALSTPRPTESIQLASGVTLAPLPFRLSIFDVMGASASGFPEAAALSGLIDHATCEIESAFDGSIGPGLSALNRIWLACSLVNLAGMGSIVCPAAMTSTFTTLRESGKGTWDEPAKPHEIRIDTLNRRAGTVLDLHYRQLTVGRDMTLAELEFGAQFARVNFDVSERLWRSSVPLQMALGASSDWCFSPDLRSGISRIWAGIEALMGAQTEIAYQLSINAACALHSPGPERVERQRRIKKLYNARSKAVHGEAVSNEDLLSATSDSLSLLRDLLKWCISRGEVPDKGDWPEIVLAGK